MRAFNSRSRQFFFIPLALHPRAFVSFFYTIVIISTSLSSVGFHRLSSCSLSQPFLVSSPFSREVFPACFSSCSVFGCLWRFAAPRVAQRLWSVSTVTPQRRRVRVAVRASLPWNTTRRLSIRHPFFCSVLSFSLSPRSQPQRNEGH